ncbi:MAG: cell division protein ZapE, partial [Microbacteriaceae bacterium]
MQRPVKIAEAPLNQLTVGAISHFHCALENTKFTFDGAQENAISQLTTPAANGYYLWGSVGRGKTVLSELYFDALPTSLKRRFHFHSFFHELQAEIALSGDPVDVSIERIIGSARAVFFDEFHVHDVADAVYLAKTLQILFDRGVLVLLTSNYEPKGLLPDPIFHDRFIPTIHLIESRMEVITLGNGQD